MGETGSPDNVAPERLTRFLKIAFIALWVVIIFLLIFGFFFKKESPTYNPDLFTEKEVSDYDKVSDQEEISIEVDIKRVADPTREKEIAALPHTDVDIKRVADPTIESRITPAPDEEVEMNFNEIKSPPSETTPRQNASSINQPPHKAPKKKEVEKVSLAPLASDKKAGAKVFVFAEEKWLIRFAVCSQKESCEKISHDLSAKSIETYLLRKAANFLGGEGSIYKLYYKYPFASKAKAETKMVKLKKMGIASIIEKRRYKSQGR